MRKRLIWEVEQQLFAAYDKAGALREARTFFKEHIEEPWCPRHRLTLADVSPWMSYRTNSAESYQMEDE